MKQSVVLLAGFLTIFTLDPAAAGPSKTAFMGIVPAELTSDIAADYGVKGSGDGILVQGVSEDSPAAEAGLRVNDVIVKVNDAKITGPEEFRTQLKKFKPQDVVDVTYMRGGKSRTAKITLGERKEADFNWKAMSKLKALAPHAADEEGMPFEWHALSTAKGAFAGIVTQTLNEGLSGYFKVKSGALISEVVKDSPAEKAGLKAGDVIIRIGDKAIESSSDVSQAIRAREPGDAVDFVVVRDGKELTVKITLGDRADQRDLGGNMLFFDDDGEHQFIWPEVDADAIRVDVKRQLKDLEDELRNLEIEIKHDGDAGRKIHVKMSGAQTISATDVIKENLLELRDKLFELLPILQEKLEKLKLELKRIEKEIQSRIT